MTYGWSRFPKINTYRTILTLSRHRCPAGESNKYQQMPKDVCIQTCSELSIVLFWAVICSDDDSVPPDENCMVEISWTSCLRPKPDGFLPSTTFLLDKRFAETVSLSQACPLATRSMMIIGEMHFRFVIDISSILERGQWLTSTCTNRGINRSAAVFLIP